MTGKKDEEVMNAREKNGHRLGKRNENPVMGNAGNGTLGHTDVMEEYGIKDSEKKLA